MKVMSKEQSILIDKLMRIAYGDALLMEEAIRISGRYKEAALLEDVVRYILKNRKET